MLIKNSVLIKKKNLTKHFLLFLKKEKRKKYLVDDGRRTWNYDLFITTFLSMLSEQQSLTGLLEENSTGRKRVHRFFVLFTPYIFLSRSSHKDTVLQYVIGTNRLIIATRKVDLVINDAKYLYSFQFWIENK